MIIFITDNILRATRVIPSMIDAGSTEDLPSLRSCRTKTEQLKAIKALHAAKIDFIVELQRGEALPTFTEFKPEGSYGGWYVPMYTEPRPTLYNVEHLTKVNGVETFNYESEVTETQIENMILCGLDITRIQKPDGTSPSKAFCTKFGLKVKRDGGILYAESAPAVRAVKAKPKAAKSK